MRTVQYEYMRPGEFLEARARFPVAYLPVGPLEWHGPHMPFGTDALDAQGIARGAAERIGGVVFPTLYCGTERARTPECVRRMGFEDENMYLVGMDVPNNTVPSCYFPEEAFGMILRENLLQILKLGFEVVVIVNAHGADGQLATCERLARELSNTTDARVLHCFSFARRGDDDLPRGHANISETSMQMYLHPDCVCLSELPPREVELKTSAWGIADSQLFEGRGNAEHTVEFDPRDATADLGRQYIERAIESVIAHATDARRK